MTLNDKEKMSFEYHKHNLNYISDHIKFADTKAGVALSLNIVLLGFLGKESKGNSFTEMNLADVGMYLSLVFLIISSVTFVWKILWPRYSKDTNLYMSWAGIATFSNSSDYIDKINSKSISNFIEDMAVQNYDISKIALQKYRCLKIGFSFLTSGAVLGLVSWYFK